MEKKLKKCPMCEKKTKILAKCESCDMIFEVSEKGVIELMLE